MIFFAFEFEFEDFLVQFYGSESVKIEAFLSRSLSHCDNMQVIV